MSNTATCALCENEIDLEEYTTFREKTPRDGTIIDAFALTASGRVEQHCTRKFFAAIDLFIPHPITHYKIIH
jgi:hypothetical protein